MLHVARDVADGMHYLHTAFRDPNVDVQIPIIHRDLKSGNVLFVQPPPPSGGGIDGLHAKVTDFGLSKDKAVDTRKQTMVRRIRPSALCRVLTAVWVG